MLPVLRVDVVLRRGRTARHRCPRAIRDSRDPVPTGQAQVEVERLLELRLDQLLVVRKHESGSGHALAELGRVRHGAAAVSA